MRSTPHARGSTVAGKTFDQLEPVYPACAGIHRDPSCIGSYYHSLPRMRGDPPLEPGEPRTGRTSTPHARGSTQSMKIRKRSRKVYPACAGIHLSDSFEYIVVVRLPRMRGDPPYVGPKERSARQSTPHARGSTCLYFVLIATMRVYPACAGIHLPIVCYYHEEDGLPRMRGDPPPEYNRLISIYASTPHARGSTQGGAGCSSPAGVYPACAGIHP